MQITRKKIYYVGLPILLLMLFLIFSSFAFYGNVHAQIKRATAPSSTSISLGNAGGKVIVVSLSKQWLYAYQNGQEVFDTAVITGRPSLATPTGTYYIFMKRSPATFHSPWPRSSPYWYPVTHVQYAMEWKPGYYLHDSWWHTVYGPGMNVRHFDPQTGWQDGSHGCISMPLDAASWLYHWAPIGTEVIVKR